MRRAAFVLAVLLLLPAVAEGQVMTLTVTNANTATSNPTLAEYQAGQMSRSFTYQLSLAGSGTYPTGCSYSGTVKMVPASANLGNSKSLADVSWSTSLGTSGSGLTQNSAVTFGTQSFTNYTSAALVTVTLTTALRWTETSTSFTGTALRFDLVASASGGNNC